MLGFIIAAASLAIGVAKDIAGAAGQNKAAKANAAAARAAQIENVKAISLQEGQQQDATAQTIMQIDRQGRNTDALARVSAGEAGVSGASVDALAADIFQQASSAKIIQKRNLEATLAQLQQQKRGAAAEAQNRINAVPGANPFAVGLSIGGQGLDFLSSRIKPKPTP